MSSILTNRSAITALAALRNTTSNLDMTSERVATGLRVSKASDDANYWTVANTLRSDSTVLGNVADSLGLGIAAMDTATNGTEQIIKILNDIKSNLITARAPAADKAKIDIELTVLKTRMFSITQSSSFNGDNWLYTAGNQGNKNIISSFSRDTSGALQVNTIQVNTATTALIDRNEASKGRLTQAFSVTQNQSATSTAQTAAGYFLMSGYSTTTTTGTEIKLTTTTEDHIIEGMTRAIEAILTSVQNVGTSLGATTTAATIQQDFIKTLRDSVDKGVSALVDADMNEESTRLKALQTQQQLGLQALSIANAESEKLLILFR